MILEICHLDHKWPCLNRNAEDVKTIVIHATAGPKTSCKEAVLNGMRERDYRRSIGLFHYLIEPDGNVVEFYDPSSKWMYHSHAGRFDKRSVAIEIEKNDTRNMILPSEAQMQALYELTLRLKNRFNIEAIESHARRANRISNVITACPGSFDIKKYSTMLGFKFYNEGHNRWVSFMEVL